jgi:hypothetical protein
MAFFFLLFVAIVPEIPSPKHHEIQEFGQNCHISAIPNFHIKYSHAASAL